MKSVQRLCALVLAMSVLALVGCESNGMMGSSSSMSMAKSVVVATGHGGAITIFSPGEKGDVVVSSSGDETCAQCKADAVEYFRTGNLKPVCTVCGATRTIVKPRM